MTSSFISCYVKYASGRAKIKIMKSSFLKIGILVLFVFISLFIVANQAKAEPYGWSPDVDNSWKGPPTCTGEKPGTPILYQPNHPLLPKAKGKGEIRLQWTKVSGATGYNIYYGLSPRNYIFSVPNLGDTDNFTVGGLANRIYYFAVQAKKGCVTGALSNEWGARPGKGGYSVTVLGSSVPVRKTVRTPVTTVSPVQEVPSATPTKTSDIKGVINKPTQPVYQPLPTVAYQPTVPIPTPTPKPKGFLQSILSIFFGK